MKELSRKVTKWAGPRLLRLGQRIFSSGGPEKAEKRGEALGTLWWTLSRRRKKTALSNLARAYPDWPESKREAVAKGVYLHFGRVAADFLSGGSRTLDQLSATTELEGIEHLEAAYARGKGVMMITGHLGNWERVSAYLSLKGHKIMVVARDADQEDVNEMVNSLREGPGTQVVARGAAARPIMERLRANEVVGILPDQNAKEIFLPFFGHPCGCVLGPGVLSERTGCTVLPVACLRVGPGRYRIRIEPPLVAQEGATQKGEGMMRAINAWLEKVITEAPDQWLWIHDRWRSARKKGLLEE